MSDEFKEMPVTLSRALDNAEFEYLPGEGPLAASPSLRAAWRLARENSRRGASWPEDFGYRGGNTLCQCVFCLETFVGFQHRTVCRLCRGSVKRRRKCREGAF